MVSHRIIIRGSGGDTQVIRGNHRLDCSTAILTSAIVQLNTAGADIPVKTDMKTVQGVPIPTKGLTGVSIDFGTVIPSAATFAAGTGHEYVMDNRLQVDINADSKSTFSQPDVVLKNVVFPQEYKITMHYPEAPTVKLTEESLQYIECIILNFECDVRNLLIG